METNNALKFAVLAGEIMLTSGAETNRVEDTMIRILRGCGFDEAEAFAAATGIFATAGRDGELPVTVVRRVRKRTINFEKIALVNDLSRAFTEQRVTLEDALRQLEKIRIRTPHPAFAQVLGSALTCFCFSYIFGGSLSDSLNAFMTGFLLQIVVMQMNKANVAGILVNMVGGMAISFFALCFMNFNIGDNLDYVIIGSIMPLVPGVSITNAIRDLFEGDYLSGGARIMDALITAVGMAAGVGTVMKMWFFLFGGVFV